MLTKDKICFGITILLIALALYFLDIKCIFKLLYGVSCPGCGLTRAYKSLIALDIESAFYYHPLFWTIPIIIFIYITNKNSKWLILFIILFVVVYIIRLLDVNCDIVTIDFKESLLYRVLNIIK